MENSKLLYSANNRFELIVEFVCSEGFDKAFKLTAICSLRADCVYNPRSEERVKAALWRFIAKVRLCSDVFESELGCAQKAHEALRNFSLLKKKLESSVTDWSISHELVEFEMGGFAPTSLKMFPSSEVTNSDSSTGSV